MFNINTPPLAISYSQFSLLAVNCKKITNNSSNNSLLTFKTTKMTGRKLSDVSLYIYGI